MLWLRFTRESQESHFNRSIGHRGRDLYGYMTEPVSDSRRRSGQESSTQSYSNFGLTIFNFWGYRGA